MMMMELVGDGGNKVHDGRCASGEWQINRLPVNCLKCGLPWTRNRVWNSVASFLTRFSFWGKMLKVFFFLRFKSKESSYFKPICLKEEDHSPRCILQQFLLVILTSQILQCGWFLWLLTHHICSVAARVVRYSSVGLVCGVSWYFLNSYRAYYTVARKYEFYFRVAKQYFTNEPSELVKYCFATRK